MLRETRVTFAYSGFILLGLTDLILRFWWLDRLKETCNGGIFWGVLLPEWSILLGAIALLGYIAWLFHGTQSLFERISLTLMGIGGTVNFFDRLLHGCVLDYFSWPLGLASFLPNFNLADMMLSFGLGGLLFFGFSARSQTDS